MDSISSALTLKTWCQRDGVSEHLALNASEACVNEIHRTTANKAVLTGCTSLAGAIPSGSEPGEWAKSTFSQALLKRGLFAYFNSCLWLSRHLGLAVILSRDLGRLWKPPLPPPSSLLQGARISRSCICNCTPAFTTAA